MGFHISGLSETWPNKPVWNLYILKWTNLHINLSEILYLQMKKNANNWLMNQILILVNIIQKYNYTIPVAFNTIIIVWHKIIINILYITLKLNQNRNWNSYRNCWNKWNYSKPNFWYAGETKTETEFSNLRINNQLLDISHNQN